MLNFFTQNKPEEQKAKGSFENLINNQLNFNFEIETRVLKKLKFKENSIEEKFQECQIELHKILKVFSDIVIFLGNITSLVYIFFAFYKTDILVICLISILLSIFFIIISFSNLISKRTYIRIEHLNIFTFIISYCIKCFVICLVYNTAENDNQSEIIRLIVYSFVFTNLLIFLKFEDNIFISLFYVGVNFSMIFISTIKSNKNHFYFLEGFMCLVLTLIFCAFRKVYDYSLRKMFANAYKFENFYNYTFDFIQGLNCFHVNYDNDLIDYIDQKFEDLLISIERNYLMRSYKENKMNLNLKINHKKNFEDTKSNDYSSINHKENNKSIYFTNSLKKNNQNKNFNIDSNKDNFLNKNSSKTIEKKKIEQQTFTNSRIKIKNKNTNNSTVVEINKILDSSNFYLNEDTKSNVISLNELTKNLFLFIDKFSISNNSKGFNLNQNLKNLFNGNENDYLNINENEENNNVISLYSLLQLIKKIENTENQFEEEIKENKSFMKIGIFNFKNEQIKKYFEVHYRRNFNKKTAIGINNEKFQYGLLFYDVSEYILSKKTVYEENISKQKMLAKIVHEFKTPINSIIGLIGSFKDKMYNKLVNQEKEKSLFNNKIDSLNDLQNFKINKSSSNQVQNGLSLKNNKNSKRYTNKSLNKDEIKDGLIDNNGLIFIIENLSNYIIFLISDIIHYSNIKDITQIKINTNVIFVPEIAMFIFEILKCLLKCNGNKDKSIEAELMFDEILNEISFQSDEIRLKQILLNIISNAVKFTKHGKIQLIFKFNSGTNEINIIVSDSGLGIKDEDKQKLFKDFVMLDSGSYQNPQGSGLGLSICKSLAFMLNLKLDFDSEFGKGSSFFVFIPLDKGCETTKSNLVTETQINYMEEYSRLKAFGQNITSRAPDLEELTSKNQQIKLNDACMSKNSQVITILDVQAAKTHNNLEVVSEKSHKCDKKANCSYHRNNENVIASSQSFYSNEFDSRIETKRIENKILNLNSFTSIHKTHLKKIDSDNLSFGYNEKYENNVNTSETKDKNFEFSRAIISSNLTPNILTSPSNKHNLSKNSLIVLQNFQLNRQNSLKNTLNSKGKKIKVINNENFLNSNMISNKTPNLDDSFFLHISSPSAKDRRLSKFPMYRKARKILLIDDNDFISNSIKSIIESIISQFKLDFEIIQCSDGVDLLKAVVEDQKDGNLIEYVFTDENMEYMNGSDAIRILRDWEKSNKIKNLKLYSLTAQDDIESTQAILASGADNVLRKPISKGILIGIIKGNVKIE